MDLVQQSVKVSAKIHCQCSNPNEQKVKLLHYHVHPFTSRQVLAFHFCFKKRIPYYVIFRKIIKKFFVFFIGHWSIGPHCLESNQTNY